MKTVFTTFLKIEYSLVAKFCFAILTVGLLSTNAIADVTLDTHVDGGAQSRSFDFNCESLYFANGYNTYLPNRYPIVDSVVQLTVDKDTDNIVAFRTMYKLKSESGDPLHTIALGPYGGPDGVLTMYHWDYARIWGLGRSDSVTFVHKNQALPDNNKLKYLVTGGTSTPTDAQALIIPESGTTGGISYGSWSGGEVNQKSGEIYFSGSENTVINAEGTGNARVMIFNPIAKTYKRSGGLKPATLSDGLKAALSSDMAIDADGNFYQLTVGSNLIWLIKIEKGENGVPWVYKKVKQLTNPVTLSSIWGMAFLNGKLYYVDDGDKDHIYVANPLTGSVRQVYNDQIPSKHTAGLNSDGIFYYPQVDNFDFASCQMAPVITGKVFLDKDGDGVVDPKAAEKANEVVSGIVVQVYSEKNNKFLGEVVTGGDGEYNLMIPEVSGRLYVRLKQPRIASSGNTHQTWASGGEYEWSGGTYGAGKNTITPVCHNGINKITQETVEGPDSGLYVGDKKYYYTTSCDGAKADGIDGSDDSISVANYYTIIDMQTDRASMRADFALAPVDRHDAPTTNGYNFGNASHYRAKNSVFLGHDINNDVDFDPTPFTTDNVNANGDDNAGKNDERSVEVKQTNNNTAQFKTVQDYLFTNGETYTFRVKTLTPEIHLQGWISFANKAILDGRTFSNDNGGKFVHNSISSNNGTYYIKDRATYNSTGKYLEFNYTVPDTQYINTANKNITKAYMRFRYTSNANGELWHRDPPRLNSHWDTHRWAFDGEVEDYMVQYQYTIKPKYVPANLTVVNQNFGNGTVSFEPSDHNKIGLFTQITNKLFSVKIVAHNNGTVLGAFEGNVTAIIDFVEYKDNTFTCDTNIKVLKPKIANITMLPSETIKGFSTTLDNATERGTFRVTYYYSNTSTVNKTTCSDAFAVRPATFRLNSLSDNLIGGKVESGTIEALSGNIVATSYNQTANKVTHQNSTLIPAATCDPAFNTTVPNSALQINTTNFINGKSNVNMSYNNIGRMNTTFVDSNWTKVDNDHSSNVYDCIPNSSTNTHNMIDPYMGRVGCDIALDETLTFVPKGFSNSFAVSNFIGNYTYLSNNLSMAAKINMAISAILYDDSTATNYHQNCFARDIKYTVQFKNNNPLDWDNRSNATQRIGYLANTAIANITSQNNGSVNLITTQGNFTNGTVNPNLVFNFGRYSNENPFTVAYTDFNITTVKDEDDVSGSGIQSGDGNVSFYLARVQSKQGRYTVNQYENATNATIYYEVYCLGCNLERYTAAIILDADHPFWYINKNHDAINAGNVTSFQKDTNKAILIRNSETNVDKYSSFDIADGSELLGVRKVTLQTPLLVKINMESPTWLEGNSTFEVYFQGDGGDWAGYGRANIDGGDNDNKTGRVITENPGGSQDIRMDW
ncbi:MAG: hypothetical protein LBJ88_04590 [Campylobacteraceae bacterium]|jgi:hypothetical protein|nr:hypothetical protein [Campylobacteraceae bacterium]